MICDLRCLGLSDMTRVELAAIMAVIPENTISINLKGNDLGRKTGAELAEMIRAMSLGVDNINSEVPKIKTSLKQRDRSKREIHNTCAVMMSSLFRRRQPPGNERNSLFMTIPRPVRAAIAALTGDPKVHNEANATELAIQFST